MDPKQSESQINRNISENCEAFDRIYNLPVEEQGKAIKDFVDTRFATLEGEALPSEQVTTFTPEISQFIGIKN